MTERDDEGSEVEIEPRICGRSVKNIFKNAYGCKMNGYTLYLRYKKEIYCMLTKNYKKSQNKFKVLSCKQ